jgi:hypothetical protein
VSVFIGGKGWWCAPFAELTADDLLVAPPDAQGRSVVSFKLSGGQVPLGPHAGERLINWCLSQK